MDSNLAMGLGILVVTICILGLVWYLLRPWFDHSAPVKDDPADLASLYADMPHIPTWEEGAVVYRRPLLELDKRNDFGEMFAAGAFNTEFVDAGPKGWPPGYATLVPTRALRPWLAKSTEGTFDYLIWAADEIEARYGLSLKLLVRVEGWTIEPFVPQSRVVFELVKEQERGQ